MAELQKEVERGLQARAILDNPLWDETFAKLAEELHRQWVGTQVQSTVAREKLWTMTVLLARLKGEFEETFKNGERVMRFLEQQRKRKA